MDGETKEGSGLIKKGLDVALSKAHFLPKKPDREAMDLAAAREVLKVVVNTPESTFTETSDLDKVGPYNSEQIREALKVVSQDITQRTGVSKFGRSYAEKQTPYGKVFLIVRQQFYEEYESGKPETTMGTLTDEDVDYEIMEKIGSKPGEPATLAMSLTAENGDRLLLCELPLKQTLVAGDDSRVGFYDRRDEGRMVSMYDYNPEFRSKEFREEIGIDGIRHMWRGTRWLSTNMLDWEKDFRLPEDLDKSLPSGDQTLLLK